MYRALFIYHLTILILLCMKLGIGIKKLMRWVLTELYVFLIIGYLVSTHFLGLMIIMLFYCDRSRFMQQ